jgi:hypothetical protein
MHAPHQGYRVSFAVIEALQEKIKELPNTATTYKIAWIVDLDGGRQAARQAAERSLIDKN